GELDGDRRTLAGVTLIDSGHIGDDADLDRSSRFFLGYGNGGTAAKQNRANRRQYTLGHGSPLECSWSARPVLARWSANGLLRAPEIFRCIMSKTACTICRGPCGQNLAVAGMRAR